MLDYIKSLNAKYDKMEEPRRFLWFICPVLVGIVLTNIFPLIGWPFLILMATFRLIGKYC